MTTPNQMAEALRELLSEAFGYGFTSPETYNDTVMNSADECWAKDRDHFFGRLNSILSAAHDAQPSAELPEPAMEASEGVCCGNFTTGGQYMGQSETLCCGRPDEAWPDLYTADQLHAFRAAGVAAERARLLAEFDQPHAEYFGSAIQDVINDAARKGTT